jgi:hypothetical protein
VFGPLCLSLPALANILFSYIDCSRLKELIVGSKCFAQLGFFVGLKSGAIILG